MNIWFNDSSNQNKAAWSIIFVQRFNGLTPEDILKVSSRQDQDRLTSYSESMPERGTINGITFARIYWMGVKTSKSSGQMSRVEGFSYATADYTQGVLIEGQDTRDCSGDACAATPMGNTTLPLTEAAALTFHKR